MTTKEFLEKLLSSQDLSPDQENDLEDHKKEVTDFLRSEFGKDPVIKYAGSFEKGTMIRDRYDLDIVCYFPSSDGRTLKEIRGDVAKHLLSKYVTTSKASAERILDLKGETAPIDFHIDVVPGRFISDTNDVFLHVAYGDKERIQTNLKDHIDYITFSGCVPIIRLVKLWAYRNKLQIRTFVLELFVVENLIESENKDNLEKGFEDVMIAFRDKFGSTQLLDPANSNNDVSRLIDEVDKNLVQQASAAVLTAIEDSDDISVWQNIFRQEGNQLNSLNSSVSITSGISTTHAVGTAFKPTRAWGTNLQ